MSIHHTWTDSEFDPLKTVLSTCSAVSPPVNDPSNYEAIDKADNVVFTYDVVWEKSDTEWHNRWDIYLNVNSPNDQVYLLLLPTIYDTIWCVIVSFFLLFCLHTFCII